MQLWMQLWMYLWMRLWMRKHVCVRVVYSRHINDMASGIHREAVPTGVCQIGAHVRQPLARRTAQACASGVGVLRNWRLFWFGSRGGQALKVLRIAVNELGKLVKNLL